MKAFQFPDDWVGKKVLLQAEKEGSLLNKKYDLNLSNNSFFICGLAAVFAGLEERMVKRFDEIEKQLDNLDNLIKNR